jgi:hypothetical protein
MLEEICDREDYLSLFSYLDTFWEECDLWYMYHDSIIIDGGFDFVKCEILRKDDRPWECSIVALFYEHTLRIQVDRRMMTLSWYREDIARECDIDLTRIDSCDGRYDDDLFWEIEYIDGDLSDIDLMIMPIMDIDFDRFMYFMVRCTMCYGMCLWCSLIWSFHAEEFGHNNGR